MERMMRSRDPTSVARHDAVVVGLVIQYNSTDCSVRQSWGKGSVGFGGSSLPPRNCAVVGVVGVAFCSSNTTGAQLHVMFY